MGLFFNYDKPGPGVEKDGPKKRGIFLFMELLWRKLGKIFLSNMLYVLVSLPVILLYHFFSFFVMSAILPAELAQSDTAVNQLTLMLTVLITVFWGTGPVSCGYTFLLRNFAREEHVWLASDFFEHIRKNFKQSIIIFLIDLVVLFAGVNSIYFYFSMAAQYPVMQYLAYFMIVCMVIYTFMHFYMYEFLVTFKVSIKDVFKNSLIMAFASAPINLFLVVFIIVATYMFFSVLTPIAIVLVTGLFWVSLMRFCIDFCSARKIKKELIDKADKGSDE